jgi:glycosyltransferase involved in cell wall biosynthesis
MTNPPEISIVTPTKIRLKLLCEAMDSAQAQTFAAWEHVIVDDGSDDGTAEEVGRRAAADPRIRYIARRGERNGANECRNQGIAESRSDLIVFLDSDDLLAPDCLARRVAAMRRNLDLDFATFQTSVFVDVPGDLARQLDPELLGDDLLRFLYFEVPWIITAPIWRKASLEKLGMFDASLPSWQDVDLHVRAIAAGLRYLRFPDVDHHVRWQYEPTKTSIEQRRSRAHLEAASGILDKFERIVREGPGLNWVRQRALCSLYFFVAENWITAGDLPSALRTWRQIRERRLGSLVLHLTGATLLAMQAKASLLHPLGARVTNKWKGWARLRNNPELV